MALRCKPGQLAFINFRTRQAVNVGKVVEVLELSPNYFIAAGIPGWVAKSNAVLYVRPLLGGPYVWVKPDTFVQLADIELTPILPKAGELALEILNEPPYDDEQDKVRVREIQKIAA